MSGTRSKAIGDHLAAPPLLETLEASPDSALVVDRQGKILLVNTNLERTFGYRRDELIGQGVETLVPEHLRGYHEEHRASFHGDPETRPMGVGKRLYGRHRDGTLIPVAIGLNPTESDGRPAVLAQIRDLTEGLRQEARLAESQARLDEAQRVGQMGHWDWNIETNELCWSDQIFRIFGLTPLEFGATYEAFLKSVHAEDRPFVTQSIEDAVERGLPYHIEHRITLPSGEVRFVQERGEVTRTPDGTPTRMLGVVIDVSDRKDLESRLRQAQKMEALGLLAGGIAHDFNNILTVIHGRTQLLLLKEELGSDVLDQLQEVATAGERASSLTTQLLAFSRKQVVRTQALHINGVVEGLRSMVSRLLGEDIELDIHMTPEPVAVKMDRGQLEQVVLNLAINGRDAMPEGGRLVIETQLRNSGEAEAVALIVRDTGAGINDKTLENIFEPYFTTKNEAKGAGLGLATVHSIVTAANGTVTVDSNPGAGTVFTVVLPQTRDTVAPPRDTRAARPYHGHETILLVEDDDTIRRLNVEGLRNFGYQLLSARDPLEAKRIVEKREAPIHVIVSDVILPGQSGPEMVQQLRPLLPDVKMIFVSGYAGERLTRHGVIEEGKGFLSKPFGPVELAKKIRILLDGA